jgi:nucleoid DNA-binding protein
VNRNELVDAVAGKASLSKTAASKAVEAVFDSITGALKSGGEVRLVGFGTFRSPGGRLRRAAIRGPAQKSRSLRRNRRNSSRVVVCGTR